MALVVDDLGIYYDAASASRLEQLASRELTRQELARVGAVADVWRCAQVSKYNYQRDIPADRLPPAYVLVVDQTYGDASVRHGLADAGTFTAMLNAALENHPDCVVLVKTHPEVATGRKKGYFRPETLAGEPRIQLFSEDVHPVALIQKAQAIYTVTSQLGFEGLIWGKPVYTFGMPFYAGWGLTRDALPAPSRRKPVSLAQLMHAALIEYSQYRDPETGQPCEIEEVLQWLALQRRMRTRFDREIRAVGFSRWKQPFVSDFLGGSQVFFVKGLDNCAAGSTIATWGRKHAAQMREHVHQSWRNILRIEDGFLRSVGLGADLIRPLSWVIDDLGIYYDANTPSRLEKLLAEYVFSDKLIERAAKLRLTICEHAITKYNVGNARAWSRPAGQSTVILVPGQVESDASIAYGTAGLKRNVDLLRAVRQSNPDAYIVYKPHPDVVAGLRSRGMGEDGVSQWCNEIVADVSYAAFLQEVDEVHVLTSLAGFEALLRNCKVVTYGQPFYAGWGLTHDLGLTDQVERRRGRRLALDELVAAVLILYPTYVSRVTRRYTTPERALEELRTWRAESADKTQQWRRVVAKLFRKP